MMRSRAGLAAAFAIAGSVVVSGLASEGTANADDAMPQLSFTKTVLPNGLTVIFHEDHTLPTAVVNVIYRTGSRMEQPKRTGFAHLFEHLMFMGTRRAPTKMFDTWMEGNGGWNNAFTTADVTDYFDVGPSTSLPLLLWLEADRQRDLGPLMTEQKLNAQRDVVRNERRQRTENQPYGKMENRLPELLYPNEHPYHHPVIGSHEDLEAAKVDDVKEFFAKWYDPANASIVVAGDFDPAAAKALIDADFATIPTHGKPVDPGAPGFDDHKTTLTSVVRETMTDRVELPAVVMAWQSPKHFGQGDAELDLLSNVLASGKESRLYKALVYQDKLAQNVEVHQESGALGSQFTITVLARPEASLDAVEAAIDAELVKVKTQPVTPEELTRAKNGYETSFVMRLESVRERASILNMYQVETGNPGYLPQDLARYRNATADSVQKAADATIDLGKRVIMRVVPEAPPAAPDAANAPKTGKGSK